MLEELFEAQETLTTNENVLLKSSLKQTDIYTQLSSINVELLIN